MFYKNGHEILSYASVSICRIFLGAREAPTNWLLFPLLKLIFNNNIKVGNWKIMKFQALNSSA